jgi:Protein of unknown function (DUF2934)
MKLAKVPRAALDVSLRLTRAPVDALIDLVPDAAGGPRSVAQRVLDEVDYRTRALLGLNAEDREIREPPAESWWKHAAESMEPRAESMEPRAESVEPPAGSVEPLAESPEPPASPAAPPPPSHEQIAARAFELYEQRIPGDADSHWETAERELGDPLSRAAPSGRAAPARSSA